MNETSTRTAPRLISVGGVLSGAAGGLGLIVLLQQFAVAYPTPIMLIIGIVGGILAHIAIVAAAGAIGRRGAPPPAVAYDAPTYEPQPYEPQPYEAQPSDEASSQPEVDAATASTQQAPWAPTHMVPAQGVGAWSTPDASSEPLTTLDPGLPVQVIERNGDWAAIVCENGWTGWVDGRLLEERV
jgi:predicted lipid-binding transport protein (Tim44 family)